MPLSISDLSALDALLKAPEAAAGTFAAIRQRFPNLSVTRADSSDLGLEPPFRQYDRFDLYLVDGTSHCWALTSDPTHATGLVLTQKAKE